MTIAIVPTFVKPPTPTPTAATERATDGASPIEDVRDGADFASILFGIPTPIAQPVRDREVSPPDDPSGAASSPQIDDSQFLATLGLPPSNQPPAPPTNVRDQIVPTRQAAAGNALIAAQTTAADRQPPADLNAQPTSERRAAASESVTAVDTPAKFAAADFAATISKQDAPVPERSMLSKPDPAATASGLNTLAAPPNNVLTNAAVTHDNHASLQTPLRDPAWAGELGHKLLWFASNEKQLAQLTVHPPQLGSIEITLNIDKSRDSATAHFASASADVRGAIEAAVPRLREMFAGAGIQLGQVSVAGESFDQQSRNQQQTSPQRRPADNAILGIDAASVLASQPVGMRRGQGMIDIFA